MVVKPKNNELIHLASEISEADDYSVPVLLVKVKDIIDGSKSLKEKSQVIFELWKYDFPSIMLTTLKYDYEKISGSWLTACQITSALIDCCFGHTSKLKLLKETFLPDLLSTLLQNLTKMVRSYSRMDKLFKGNLLGNLSLLISSLTKLTEYFTFLSIDILSSKHFLQFLMIEDSKLSLLAQALLKNLIQANRNSLDHIPESRMHSISDELTFKITSTSDTNVARVAMSILLLLMDLHAPLLQLLSSKRYRGFKTYVGKWLGNGFDQDVNRMIKILDVHSESQLASNKLHHNAILIQSVYRGYQSRKRLRFSVAAISKFQRMYRAKKKNEEKTREKQKREKWKDEYAEKNRRKEFVGSRSKQLKIIETIPAKTVSKFLDNLQNESAKKIQAAWLGSKTRNQMKTFQPYLKRQRAAITIQRQVRKWLDHRRKKLASALLDLVPSGLNDERKVELQNVITNIREKFPTTAQTDDEFRAAHEKTFRTLNNHVIALRQVRRRDDHRRALMAQLSIQADQMSYFPPLDGVRPEQIEHFSSRSTPIMMAARRNHINAINDLKKPWWERLDSENKDSLLEYQSQFIQDSEKQF